MEQIIQEIKKLEKKLAPDQEWHQISQKDANAMKNYNNGLKDAIAIIEKFRKELPGPIEVVEQL